MKKFILSTMVIFLLVFAGCGEDGKDGLGGANGKDANVSFSSDINNTVKVDVKVSLEELTDKNVSNDEFNLSSALVIIPTAVISYEGGDFDVTLIPTKDNTLYLKEKAIMLTKTIDGQVQDTSWADINYDVLHDIYTISGTINYGYNALDTNISSLIQAVYFTNGETKFLQSIAVTQLANKTEDINVTHNLVVDVTDGNYTVTQEQNGTIKITQD